MTEVQVLGIVHRENVSVVAPRKEEAGSNQVEKVHVIDYTLFSCTSRIVDNTSKLYTPVGTQAWFEGEILG